MFLLFYFLLGYIAYCDIAKRKIKNLGVLGFFLLGCVGIWLDTWFIYSYKTAFLSMAIVFLGGLVFYALRVMAAGDVKLCAVLAFCMGLENFLGVWLVSLFVSLIYVLLAYLKPSFFYKRTENIIQKEIKGRARLIPYGLVLAISVLIFQNLKRW